MEGEGLVFVDSVFAVEDHVAGGFVDEEGLGVEEEHGCFGLGDDYFLHGE